MSRPLQDLARALDILRGDPPLSDTLPCERCMSTRPTQEFNALSPFDVGPPQWLCGPCLRDAVCKGEAAE